MAGLADHTKLTEEDMQEHSMQVNSLIDLSDNKLMMDHSFNGHRHLEAHARDIDRTNPEKLLWQCRRVHLFLGAYQVAGLAFVMVAEAIVLITPVTGYYSRRL
jgi:hypothetical protein